MAGKSAYLSVLVYMQIQYKYTKCTCLHYISGKVCHSAKSRIEKVAKLGLSSFHSSECGGFLKIRYNIKC